ncbi:MAG: hypothetical protein IT168_32215 [Bryobacterales bacterium]|nr:hypothetical protein [Bryobacterales bacterium]
MSLQPRDRRALAMLGVSVILTGIVYLWPQPGPSNVVSPTIDSIPIAEQRLAKLRQVVATIPGKQQVLDGVIAQLKDREKGLLDAETAAQSQAQLLQIIRRVARAQSPPLEIGMVEMGQIQNLGGDYGEALVSVTVVCRIEQLVNLLADLTAQSEAVSTYELQVRTSDLKQKTVTVRVTVAGVLPKRLAPERKGMAAF